MSANTSKLLIVAGPLVALLLLGCSGGGSTTQQTASQVAGYVYVVNSGGAPGTVSQFTIGSNGAMTLMAAASVPAALYPIAIVAVPAR